MKKIYGIGTGPGNPENLTLKAVRVMEGASVVFAPSNRGKNMAIDTAREFIEGKKIVFIDFPMGNVTREDYKKAAKTIYDQVEDGQYGVFLTIGDPMIYSTFIYILEELEGIQMEVEIVPGVPSFVGAASSARQALTVKGDTFTLCDEVTKEILDNSDSVAILKSFKNKEEILDLLEDNNYEYTYVRRATLENQLVLHKREEILKDKDYISLILGRKKK